MKRLIFNNKLPILIVLLLFTIHWTEKDIFNPWQRPIAGDAQGYYAYLPALFIYQDLEYEFLEEVNPKYYAPGHAKDFVFESNGEKVNKTFPGISVLYAPFFFAAHVTAQLFGLEADGYSNIYQLSFDIGFWIYFLLGLIMLRKVLDKLGFSSKTINLSLVFIVFGTNITFFTVYDQSVTHIQNFFLVNLMIYWLIRFKELNRVKYLFGALAVLSLIGIIRPTNVLVIGLIVFFFPDMNFYKNVFKTLLNRKNWYLTLLIPIGFLSIPIILWKAQTGSWIVYSYGEEGFDFLRPHFVEFLFSYTKGWFTYTPIMLLIFIFGLIILFYKKKKQAIIGMALLLGVIYVYSSWWCWYYGAGLSQRVMIDYFIMAAFLLALVLKFIDARKMLQWSFLLICSLLSLINIAQTWQVGHGIYPNGSPTKAQYWDNFLVFEKRARVYPYEHWKFEGQVPLYEKSLDIDSSAQYKIFDGNAQINTDQPKSTCLSTKGVAFKSGHKIVISFEAKANSQVLWSVLKLTHPVDSVALAEFTLANYIKVNEWVRMEFLYEPNDQLKEGLEFYFDNLLTGEQIEFKNVKVERYFSEDYL